MTDYFFMHGNNITMFWETAKSPLSFFLDMFNC